MTQTIDHPTTPSWPTPPPPPPPPPAKRSMKPGAAIAIIFVFILMGVGLAGIVSAAGKAGASHTVTYLVEGTTNMASITYKNAAGDTSQQSDIDVPIRRKSDGGEGLVLSDMKSGDFLYISAQNSQGSGSVTCAIEVDGVRVKENTSRGAYTIATCSGRL